jgi:hypothetical protein
LVGGPWPPRLLGMNPWRAGRWGGDEGDAGEAASAARSSPVKAGDRKVAMRTKGATWTALGLEVVAAAGRLVARTRPWAGAGLLVGRLAGTVMISLG